MLMRIHRLLSQKENSRFSRTLLFYGTIFLLMLLQLPRGTLSVNCEDFCEGERDRWGNKDDLNGVFMFNCEQYTNWIDQVACLDNCDCGRDDKTVTNCDKGKFTCAKKESEYEPPKPSPYDGNYGGHGNDARLRYNYGAGLILMVIFVYILIPICCIVICVFAIIGCVKATQPAYAPPIVMMPTGYAQPQPQIIQIRTPAPASSSASTN